MSRRATTIAVAAAAVVVIAGLVALALPAITAATTALTGFGSRTSDLEATFPPADETPRDVHEDATADGVPDGYVFVGNGTWIPAGGPGDCTAPAYIQISKSDDGPWTASLYGELVDMGPREFAAGSVGYATNGRIATYTVAPGDAPWAIGDRFCIYNGLAVESMNGYSGGDVIQPGDVLVLDPGAIPGFTFVYPYAG